MRNLIVPSILSLLLTILIVNSASAQNCGCAEEGNCPEAIAAITDFNVCYTFTDAFNNNLADPAQGICGVNVSFNHDYIWDLELTLSSPSGQEVMLVGENTAGTGGTNFTSWEVLFVPCGDTAEPEGSFSQTWTNDQSWPFIGAIGGSYYPVSGGCLEDFDTGPVNGQWCINVNSQSFAGVSGNLFDFEVILCDQSGIFCCDADGGDLDDDLIACEGDQSLVLNLEPEYVGFPPEATEYGYTYFIGEIGGLLLEVNESPDLSAFPAGNYEVCGLSYDLNEVAQIPAADGITTMQDIKDDLNGLNPSFCGSLSDDCYPVTITPLLAPTNLIDTICVGENYPLGDSTFTESGDYSITLSSQFGCDSLVNLNLAVLPVDTGYVVTSICLGDSLVIADSTFYATGNYEVFVSGASRCDSIYLVDLNVIEPVVRDISANICLGDAYEVGSTSYSTAGLYSDTITSVVTGCDSIVNLDLSVIEVVAVIAEPDTITCAFPTITLDGSASTSAPGTTYEWVGEAGGVVTPPIDNNTIQISDNGFYKLRVTQSGCTDSTLVSVIELDEIPEANAGTDTLLTCTQTAIQLDGTASEMGADLIYTWSTFDGNILAGEENSLQPTINLAPATYTLSVRNTLTNCESMDSVFVNLDAEIPPVDAGSGGVLNCQNEQVNLDASASFIDNNHTYIWTNAADMELAQGLTTSVNQLGTYYFTITENATGCTSTDSVSVTDNYNEPLPDAGIDTLLTCQIDEIQLQGSVLNSPDFTLSWTGAGNITDPASLSPTINTAGWYYLEVTDNESECLAIDSVFVDQIEELPEVDAADGSLILDCQTTSLSLGDPQETSQGVNFTYSWTLDDVFVSNDFPLLADQEGEYILTVTNLTTGCSRQDTALVFETLQQPIATTSPGGELNCEVTVINLMGFESGPLPDDAVWINYNWYDEAGELVGTGQNFDAYTSGEYQLIINETISFCADTTYVTVSQDDDLPIAEAGDNVFLDCESSTANLSGIGSSVGNYAYQWTGPDGAIIANPNSLSPTVNEIGTYVLEVNSTDADCSSADAVTVSIDTSACIPLIEISPGFELFADGENGIVDCLSEDNAFVPSVGLNFFLDTLDASATDFTADNIEYEWTAIDGFIIDENDPNFPIVTAGTFVLTLTNTLLNISASDTISVIDLRDFPNANAGQDQLLDCTGLQSGYVLDGSASDQGADFSYIWTTDEGDFGDSDLTSLDPVIYAPGFYELTVTNNSNACVTTEGVLIDLIGQIPTPCIISQYQMECIDQTIMIGDTCDLNPDYLYNWSVIQDGFIQGSDTESSILVRTDTAFVSALFQVVVTDMQNGCTFTDTVEVFTAVNCYPECVVNPEPPLISCLESTSLLDGTGSSVGADFIYSWEQVGGVGGFCGDNTALQVCIEEEGIYQLTVTNTETNFACQSALVFVDEQIIAPDVIINPEASTLITCNEPELTLSANSSDTDAYSFAWTSPEACILTDTFLPEVSINCAGLYNLTVVDLETGCENISQITINYDTLPPGTAIVTPNTALIGCTNPQVVLDGSGSSQGIYQWYQDGNLILGENNLTYLANEAGEYCLVITDPNNGCTTSACSIVTEDPNAVPADAGEDQFITCAGGLAQLSGTAPLDPNYDFVWSTDAGVNCFFPTIGNLNITATCVGTYTLTVTDLTTGCQGISTVEVIDARNPPIVQAGDDMELDCETTQVLLDGSSSEQSDDFIYNWVGMPQNPQAGDTPLTAIATAPGLYTLLIFNETTSCFAIDTVTVTQTAFPPQADAGNDAFLTCSTTQIQLSGSNSTQNDSLSYQWTAASGEGILSPADDLDISVNQGGDYYLSVQNDSTNCISIDTVSVLFDTLPPQALIELENQGQINCFEDTININANNSEPQGILNFQWTTTNGEIISPFNLPEISVNAAGSYNLELTNTDNGCSSDTSVTIVSDFTLPSISIAPPGELTCLTESVQLDGSNSQENSSFSWSSLEGFFIENATSSTPSIFEAGTYILNLTSLDNGCVNEENIVITENRISPIAIANTEGMLDCNTNSIALDGTGSSTGATFTYEWQGTPTPESANSLTTEAIAAGIYQLIVTDNENGCQDTSFVTVEAAGLPITEIFTSLQLPNCQDVAGGFIQIDSVTGGNPPYLFGFNGSTLSEYDYRNYLTTGNYDLVVEDLNGCTYDTTLFLGSAPELLIELGADIEIENGDSTLLNVEINLPEAAIDTIIWRPLPDETCPGCPQQMLDPLETMAISVEVIDTFGCSATDQIFIYVVGGEESPLFVPTAFSPNGDGQNETLTIYGKEELVEIELFQVFDRWGTMVFEAQSLVLGDIENAWDGTHQGQLLNSQVFAWRLEYSLRGQEQTEVIWGDVSLLR